MIEAANSTNLTVTATSVVSANPAVLMGVILTPAAAASEIIIYDNASTSTSAVVIVDIKVQASVGSIILPISAAGISCKNGITAVVTGSGAVAQVIWNRF